MPAKDSAGQERTNRPQRESEEAPPADGGDVQERVGKLTEDVDALLDDIDDVLEENAEDFIKGYVQKGGQ